MDPVTFFEIELPDSASPIQTKKHIESLSPNMRVYFEYTMNSSYHILLDDKLTGYTHPDEYAKIEADLMKLGKVEQWPLYIQFEVCLVDPNKRSEAMNALEAIATIEFGIHTFPFHYSNVMGFGPPHPSRLFAYMKDPDEFEQLFDAELHLGDTVCDATGHEYYDLQLVKEPSVPRGLDHLIQAIVYHKVFF